MTQQLVKSSLRHSLLRTIPLISNPDFSHYCNAALLTSETNNDTPCTRSGSKRKRSNAEDDEGHVYKHLRVQDMLSLTVTPAEIVVMNELNRMTNYLQSRMYAIFVGVLESVGIIHAAQAQIIRSAVARTAHLLGCDSIAQKRRLLHWCEQDPTRKKLSLYLMSRGSGKSTAIMAYLTILTLNYVKKTEKDDLPIHVLHQNGRDAIKTVEEFLQFLKEYCQSDAALREKYNTCFIHFSRTTGIATIRFPTYTVIIQATSQSSVRGKHPKVIIVDEFAVQSSQWVEDAMLPILNHTDTKARFAFCFSTPATHADGIIQTIMTGDASNIAHVLAQSMVCDRPNCNSSSEAMLNCIHRLDKAAPWLAAIAFAEEVPHDNRFYELVNTRCYVQGTQSSGIRPEILEKLMIGDGIKIAFKQPGVLDMTATENIQATVLTIACDPDFGMNYSRLGICCTLSFRGAPGEVKHLLVAATTIDPLLPTATKQQVIYLILSAIRKVYERLMGNLTAIHVAIEANNAGYAATGILEAVHACAKDVYKKSVLLAQKKLTMGAQAAGPDTSIPMTTAMKMRMVGAFMSMIETGRMVLPPFMLEVVDVNTAKHMVELQLSPTNAKLTLMKQLRAIVFTPISGGGFRFDQPNMKISGKTRDSSDDLAMAFFIACFGCMMSDIGDTEFQFDLHQQRTHRLLQQPAYKYKIAFDQ